MRGEKWKEERQEGKLELLAVNTQSHLKMELDIESHKLKTLTNYFQRLASDTP